MKYWLLILLLLAGPVAAQEAKLRLPRFVSLNANEINVRTGPGVRYPIEWVFTRRSLPVEIIAEFDTWRKIRDWQGAEGWVHQSVLSGRRTVLVQGKKNRPLRRIADEQAMVVAEVQPAVVASLLGCDGRWCRVDADGHRGWLLRSEVWGVYPNEDVR